MKVTIIYKDMDVKVIHCESVGFGVEKNVLVIKNSGKDAELVQLDGALTVNVVSE